MRPCFHSDHPLLDLGYLPREVPSLSLSTIQLSLPAHVEMTRYTHI